MAYNVIPIDQAAARMPALMRQRMQSGQSINSNFSDGIADAFPVLSIKGKVFRARISGQETPFIDPQTRQPIAFLDVVLVNASKHLAKTYYVKGFTEGDNNPPDCWSLDSIRPDPSVANKVNLTCGNCPMNAFGSKITEDGKQAKACQDARRVAVVMPHQLGDESPMVLLLRVPQSSLKNLKAYAQMLERHGFEPAGCVTRVAFDYQVAHPKLLFNFVAPLDDGQYQKVVDLADGSLVSGMLAAPDFDNAPSTMPQQDTGTQHVGMGGLAPQAGPVLANQPVQASQTPSQGAPAGMIELPDGRLYDTATGSFVDKPKPVEPKLETVQSNFIELPDGKLFNPATGQYVERPQPAVQMPELDPATITLPDGKFFNTVSKLFVTGPEKGAKELTAEAPATRTRKPRGPNKPKADAQQQQQQAQPEPAQAPEQDQGEPVLPGITEAQKPAEQTAPPPNANGGGAPVVSAASLSLQEMLTKLVPTS